MTVEIKETLKATQPHIEEIDIFHNEFAPLLNEFLTFGRYPAVVTVSRFIPRVGEENITRIIEEKVVKLLK